MAFDVIRHLYGRHPRVRRHESYRQNRIVEATIVVKTLTHKPQDDTVGTAALGPVMVMNRSTDKLLSMVVPPPGHSIVAWSTMVFCRKL